MRNVDTFFRGHRRETFIDGATILCNAAGEKRLKLSMKLPLTGDQLVGMPTWVEGPFVDISKPDFALKSPISSNMELDPMILRVYCLPEDKLPLGDQEALITFDGVRMCSFKIQREDKDDPDIALTFTAYLPRTGKFLAFADENFNASLYVVYEAAQQSLLDTNPNVQPNDPSPDDEEDDDDDEKEADEFEAARREATSPAHDEEFGVVSGKKAIKDKPAKRSGGKRDGYGKPISAAVQ